MEDRPRQKTRTSPAAVKKWQAAHIKRYCLPVSIDSERDIIEKLDSVPNKAGYIKSLIRADIEKEGKTMIGNRIAKLEKFFGVKKPMSIDPIEWLDRLYEMEMEWEENNGEPFPI